MMAADPISYAAWFHLKINVAESASIVHDTDIIFSLNVSN
jgi:hypothetical protein